LDGESAAGEVSAARIWAHLRASASGRRALVAAATHHARVSLRMAGTTRIVVRAAR